MLSAITTSPAVPDDSIHSLMAIVLPLKLKSLGSACGVSSSSNTGPLFGDQVSVEQPVHVAEAIGDLVRRKEGLELPDPVTEMTEPGHTEQHSDNDGRFEQATRESKGHGGSYNAIANVFR